MNNKLYRVAYKLEQKRRNELDKKIIEVIVKGKTNEKNNRFNGLTIQKC